MQKSTRTLPPNFSEFTEGLLGEMDSVEGYLSPIEIRFLGLLGAYPTAGGKILEIGSFKGKSTIILARSSALAGDNMVNAVDPMTAPSETDPDLDETGSSLADFRANTERCNVSDRISLHQMTSQELSKTWTEPLRLLWIDGDHTYKGTKSDFESFAPFMADRGIIAVHDVLHEFEGGLRVFMEDILLSPNFGACGFCGSIGWAQYHADGESTKRFKRHKLVLYKKLSRLIPFIAFGADLKGFRKRKYKVSRWLIPKSAVDPQKWIESLDQGRL